MRRGIGRLRAGGGGFSPISVFAGGAAGLWLDPSDITTGYTDSIGTTPQTASGQQTGLRLDKRLGLSLGPELSAPSTSTAGWTAINGSTLASIGGELQVTSGGLANGGARQVISGLTVGKSYQVLGTGRQGTTTAPAQYFFGTAGVAFSTTVATAKRYVFVATATSANFDFYINATETGTTAYLSGNTVKLLDGNHVTQSTGSARPEYDVISGISSDFLDGLDDGYSTTTLIAGALTSNMDCFVAIKRAGAAVDVAASSDASSFLGVCQSGSGTLAFSGVGANTTHFVNGVQIGGTNTTTRDQLSTATTPGTWKILEIRNLDLSLWTAFRVGVYGSLLYSGDIGGVVCCPAQSSTNRDSLRKWLGARVGLSL